MVSYRWTHPMSMLQNSHRLHRVPTPNLSHLFCSSVRVHYFNNLTESHRKPMNCKQRRNKKEMSHVNCSQHCHSLGEDICKNKNFQQISSFALVPQKYIILQDDPSARFFTFGSCSKFLVDKSLLFTTCCRHIHLMAAYRTALTAAHNPAELDICRSTATIRNYSTSSDIYGIAG